MLQEANKNMKKNLELINRLKQLVEEEARSCSMDFGCITPLYVYRMYGGQYSIEDIENGLKELREQGFMNIG